jgi:hypothetical protein
LASAYSSLLIAAAAAAAAALAVAVAEAGSEDKVDLVLDVGPRIVGSEPTYSYH